MRPCSPWQPFCALLTPLRQPSYDRTLSKFKMCFLVQKGRQLLFFFILRFWFWVSHSSISFSHSPSLKWFVQQQMWDHRSSLVFKTNFLPDIFFQALGKSLISIWSSTLVANIGQSNPSAKLINRSWKEQIPLLFVPSTQYSLNVLSEYTIQKYTTWEHEGSI